VHLVADKTGWDPFPPTQRTNDTTDRREANRALGVSAVGLALTGLAELAISVLSGSVGLLGDALHNLSDVSTSLVVFLGFSISRRPATAAHPYGYERAEDLAGLGVAAVVWASAVFAATVSIHKLTEHGRTSKVGLGIAAAAVGILGNQLVARYKLRVGRQINSATLIADAQHSWLDALSSAGALLGLVGVALGWTWADGVAGLIVTGFIVHVGWEITGEIVVHLMDGVDSAIIASAEQQALSVAGVEHVHVRGRWLGRSLIIEVEGFVSSSATVAVADALGRQVEQATLAAIPDCTAVLWAARGMPTPRSISP